VAVSFVAVFFKVAINQLVKTGQGSYSHIFIEQVIVIPYFNPFSKLPNFNTMIALKNVIPRNFW